VARRRTELDGPPEHVAGVLRERIYGGIACLSTLLVLARPADEVSAWRVFVDVAVATGGLWAASVLADLVSEIAVRGRGPRGREALDGLRESGQILEAAYVPLLLVALAGFGVMRLAVALRGGIWVSIIELGLFALLAVRRTTLPVGKRMLVVAALMGLGALVVLIKTIAH
jgi:hypothetical protein